MTSAVVLGGSGSRVYGVWISYKTDMRLEMISGLVGVQYQYQGITLCSGSDLGSVWVRASVPAMVRIKDQRSDMRSTREQDRYGFRIIYRDNMSAELDLRTHFGSRSGSRIDLGKDKFHDRCGFGFSFVITAKIGMSLGSV